MKTTQEYMKRFATEFPHIGSGTRCRKGYVDRTRKATVYVRTEEQKMARLALYPNERVEVFPSLEDIAGVGKAGKVDRVKHRTMTRVKGWDK